MVAPPLDLEPVRAVWRAAGGRPLVLALSGGGDSVALLALLREAEPQRPLIAVIIDHALREGSDKVAAAAAAQAKDQGAKAVVRRLTWEEAAPRNQAAARTRRYRAIAQIAHAAQAPVVAVAHTLDDQAETALIKRARTGRWGEAGMSAFAPFPVWPEGLELTVARPLLGVRRAELRAWARARGLIWHEDPANADPAFLRARARGLLQADDCLALRLAAHADRAAKAALNLNAKARAWIAANAVLETEQGRLRLAELPSRRPGRRALSALIGAVAGDPAAAPPEALARMADRLAQGAASVTLGGAQVRRLQQGFALRRDPGALLGRAGVSAFAERPLIPFQTALVDARLVLATAEEGFTVCVSPKAELGLRRRGHWIALNAAKDVSHRWLTDAHLRHVLPVDEPFPSCDAAKGVQQTLGLLS